MYNTLMMMMLCVTDDVMMMTGMWMIMMTMLMKMCDQRRGARMLWLALTDGWYRA